MSNSRKTPQLIQHVILVVEDDPTYLEAIDRLLTEEGYLVRSATSAVGALQKFNEAIELGRLDVCLIDIILTMMTGIKLAKHFRDRHYTGPNLLFMSGCKPYQEDFCKIEDFFIKPVDTVMLFRRLDELIGGPYTIKSQ